MDPFTTFSPPSKPHIICHAEYEQGSEAWLQARCGLLTASEMKLLITMEGGNTVTSYKASDTPAEKMTPLRRGALEAIGKRVGAVRDLAFAANVSDGVIRGLIKDGSIEAIKVVTPVTWKALSDDREKAHLYELLAQRVNQYVEPHFFSFDMERGHADEVEARIVYDANYAETSTDVAFITNSAHGFTLGYSPDGLVGDDGAIECKSRRQKYQMQTILEGGVPSEYLMQLQTGLLVSERAWIDFISYSGGMPMYVERVYPDDTVREAIINIAGDFERRLSEKLALYHENAAEFIPTERKIEQEMYA